MFEGTAFSFEYGWLWSDQKTLTFILLVVWADHLLGDPVFKLHPVRLLGGAASFWERLFFKVGLSGYLGGLLQLLILLGLAGVFVALPFYYLIQIHPLLGETWHFLVAFFGVALKDLCDHATRVGKASQAGDLKASHEAVRMMVSRDVEPMDDAACNRAAIESVAENLTDGVIAPLFYLALLGPLGLAFFKVASTLDSMVGYKSEKYHRFGFAAAKLDDLLNFIPARLTWMLIVVASAALPGFYALKAIQIGLSQHGRLDSPNSGWSEAAAAGALGLRLGGPAWRAGVAAPVVWIGSEDAPPASTEFDIRRMILLARTATFFFLVLCWGFFPI